MPIEMAFDMKSASIQAAFAAGLRKVFDNISARSLSSSSQIASSVISRLPAENNETCCSILRQFERMAICLSPVRIWYRLRVAPGL